MRARLNEDDRQHGVSLQNLVHNRDDYLSGTRGYSAVYNKASIVVYQVDGRTVGLRELSHTARRSPRPRPGLIWYGATKAGITNASKGLALEWAKYNIRFNVIHPVAGETNM